MKNVDHLETRKYLDKQLLEYSRTDRYPFHMPGHKRQNMGIDDPVTIDITEIDGFDNLHHAEGILKEAQERMAAVFGAEQSFFLVNGSTCGLLAAICSSVRRGGKILVARNCHKAVYHGIFLQGLEVVYVYPMETEWGIQGSIDPEDIREKLEADPDIQAVLLTSPTYDGVVSDIEKISQITNAYQIPLIVDEAHGAHFGFSKGFPKKAIQLGADVVIESLHKTLPSFTQTAVLHVRGNRVDVKRIRYYLGVFQTSSPSYLFMAGMDRCSRLLEQFGEELFSRYEKRLEAFYRRAKDLQYLQVCPAVSGERGIFEKEDSKILIFTKGYMSGRQLAELLLEQYGLQMEMETLHYVTALTSIMDTEEGFERLLGALFQIDQMLEEQGTSLSKNQSEKQSELCRQWMDALYCPKEKRVEIQQAQEMEAESVALSQAVGRISCEFAYLYPPGIPFLVPGEVVPASLPSLVDDLRASGFEIQGLEDYEGERINVAT